MVGLPQKIKLLSRSGSSIIPKCATNDATGNYSKILVNDSSYQRTTLIHNSCFFMDSMIDPQFVSKHAHNLVKEGAGACPREQQFI